MDRPELLSAAATLAVDGMTVEVVGALHAAGVRPILLKGASFAALLYPEGGRRYADCDLLVSTADLAPSRAVLDGLGFADWQKGYARSERPIDTSTYVRGNALVDLHWNLHLARDPDVTWEALSGAREDMTLGGQRVDILNVAGRAMHVAIHAAQHGLDGPQRHGEGGQTGEDLRRALRVVGDHDWQRAAELATAIGADDAFAYGLRLEPAGVALAEALALPDAAPELWRYRTPFVAARGGDTFRRLVAAPTLSEKASVLLRSFVPSRARVRNTADSRFGRSSLVGAYLEHWADAVRGLGPAIRSARALRRADRQRDA